eukprot:5573349-Karenia_brevis.AAC.1
MRLRLKPLRGREWTRLRLKPLRLKPLRLRLKPLRLKPLRGICGKHVACAQQLVFVTDHHHHPTG